MGAEPVIKLTVALRQLVGLGIIVFVMYRVATETVVERQLAWVGFCVGVAMVAPEVVQEFVKAYKEFRA